MDTLYLEKSGLGVKLTIKSPSGTEVKDILNFTVVPLDIIGTTTYNFMCLEGAGLCLAEEQLVQSYSGLLILITLNEVPSDLRNTL
jgi:hypothetical protein